MKIVFLCRFSAYRVGGVETHVKKVAAGLENKGHTVNIISNIKYPKIKFLGLLVIWWQLLKTFKVIKTADVVHVHDVFIWYLPLRFLFLKKPVFITFHGYETKFPPSRWSILIRKISEKLSWGNICVGDYIKKWYGTKPTYTTYGGVRILPINTNTTNTTNKNNKLKILFIGRLEKDTGVNIYLQVLKILKKKRIRFEFEACGDGQLRSEVEKIGQVHGFVKDISFYLARSDLVFSSSYLSILEAMVNKKLVFAVFNNPLKEDYLKMTSFAQWIIIENSSIKLVKKMQYYLSHKITREKLTNRAYQWVKSQTWEEVVKVYESFHSGYGLK